jgi:hypothetical protein
MLDGCARRAVGLPCRWSPRFPAKNGRNTLPGTSRFIVLTTIDPRLRLRLEKRALGYSLEGFVGQVGERFGVATRWVELASSFVKSIEPFGASPRQVGPSPPSLFPVARLPETRR